MALQARFKKRKLPNPGTTPREDIFMTPQQAADFTTFSVDLIYSAVKSGELPHIPKGSGKERLHFALYKPAIIKWMLSKQVAA